MDAPSFEVSPQFAGPTLCFGECLSSFGRFELACFVYDEATKRERLIHERTHRLVALWLATVARRFHGKADEFENVRSILLGVLAFCEGVVDPNAFRCGSGIRHLAGNKKILNFRACESSVRVAERTCYRLKLILCEYRHLRFHLLGVSMSRTPVRLLNRARSSSKTSPMYRKRSPFEPPVRREEASSQPAR